MKHPKVFVTRPIPQAGLNLLKRAGLRCAISLRPEGLPRAEFLRRIRGMDGILCLLTDRFDAQAMDAAGAGLKVLSNHAVGYDNIDVPAATQRGILVANTPGVLTETTAEMAWALLFAVARRIVESDRYTRSGQFKFWNPMLFHGHDVSGKTLGIVGAGRIGSAVARMASGFSMKILYHSRSPNAAMESKTGARKVNLPALLAQSDFISVHVPMTPQTRHLIGAKELARMKPNAILINTARGPIVDENALVQALRKKLIAGAGLDVYEREPKLARGLAALPNAVLTPHTASATVETRDKMAMLAAENLVLALRGKRPRHCVNPEAFR